jgi:hypothetical protein
MPDRLTALVDEVGATLFTEVEATLLHSGATGS